MEFLDRKDEIAELNHALSPDTPPQFVVVLGRRRLGKSTLIKRVLTPTDVYYMAGDIIEHIQRDLLKAQLAEKYPELGFAEYTSWEDLFRMLNTLTKSQFTLCLDEFPYMVKHSPELPSVLQRLLDSKELKYNIIICGSSQRMMQNMILSQSEPLFGRAHAILNIQPLPLPYLQKALHADAITTIEEYSVWGGVPRYWELRVEYPDLKEAIRNTMLSPTSVLYDEPKRLFLDDMTATVQSESLMAIVAGGANRLSEIAARMGREATALSGPIDRLIQMHYLRREIPFGESPKKSKKSLYRIHDPLVNFYYTFIMPNLSNIGRGRRTYVLETITRHLNEYVSLYWEYLCRETVSGNRLFGYRWQEAARWWGSIKTATGLQTMEFDVVAESEDGKALLVGECKWTTSETANVIQKRLLAKAAYLPFAKNKKIIPVLFLKNRPKGSVEKVNILYPQDIVDLSYGE